MRRECGELVFHIVMFVLVDEVVDDETMSMSMRTVCDFHVPSKNFGAMRHGNGLLPRAR